MPKTIKEERLRWVLAIANKEVKLVDISKVCPYSKRSLERWVSLYKKYGIEGLIPQSTRPRTNPKETSIHIKERIVDLRKETKLCALKLSWKLKKEGISIHERTIGKIIKVEGLTRKYRIRRIKYKYVKAKLLHGELVEIDIKYVPKKISGIKYYQYTAIDCASRWRYMKVYSGPTTYCSLLFLRDLLKVAPFDIKAIKTDNGACFTNRYVGYLKSADPMNPRLHPLDILCRKLGIEHYLIDPGKPAQNGKVERSHRSDQEMFYDRNRFNTLEELKYRLKLWNMYYNSLEHCGLNGESPNQVLGLSS